MFSHLSLNLSTDLISHGDCHILLVKKKLPVQVPQTVRPPHWMPGEVKEVNLSLCKQGQYSHSNEGQEEGERVVSAHPSQSS